MSSSTYFRLHNDPIAKVSRNSKQIEHVPPPRRREYALLSSFPLSLWSSNKFPCERKREKIIRRSTLRSGNVSPLVVYWRQLTAVRTIESLGKEKAAPLDKKPVVYRYVHIFPR